MTQWTLDDLALDPDRCIVQLDDGSTATLAQARAAGVIPNTDNTDRPVTPRRTTTT